MGACNGALAPWKIQGLINFNNNISVHTKRTKIVATADTFHRGGKEKEEEEKGKGRERE